MVTADDKALRLERANSSGDLGRVRVKRKTLEAVLQQCQMALELLSSTGCIDEQVEDDDDDSLKDGAEDSTGSSSPLPCCDKETDEVYTRRSFDVYLNFVGMILLPS